MTNMVIIFAGLRQTWIEIMTETKTMATAIRIVVKFDCQRDYHCISERCEHLGVIVCLRVVGPTI